MSNTTENKSLIYFQCPCGNWIYTTAVHLLGDKVECFICGKEFFFEHFAGGLSPFTNIKPEPEPQKTAIPIPGNWKIV